MSPEEFIVAQLEAGLAEIRPAVARTVMPWTRTVESVPADLVLVTVAQVVPNPAAASGRDYSGELLAVSPFTDGSPAGVPDVDDLREDLLAVLERSGVVTWQAATRATLDDAWPAWEITFTYPLIVDTTTAPGGTP